MVRITAPISRNDRNPRVPNLQQALLFLIERGRIQAGGDLPPKIGDEQRVPIYGEATQEAVKRFQRQHGDTLGLRITEGERVDEATAAAMNRMIEELGGFAQALDDYVITGRVEFEDGTPAPGIVVTAADRDLGARRTPLGNTQELAMTLDSGEFPDIHYTLRDFQGGEGDQPPAADLVFAVSRPNQRVPVNIAAIYRTSRDGGAEIRIDDPLLGFRAAPVEQVRIVLAGRPSVDGTAEYSRLMAAVKPLLDDRQSPADLDQERFRDVDFAAREIGWDRDRVQALGDAWRLAREAVVPDDDRERVAETYYGLVRPGPPMTTKPLPATLTGVMERRGEWEVRLREAVDRLIVSGRLEDHLARLTRIRIDRAVATSAGGVGIGDLLDGLGVAEDERRRFLELHESHRGDPRRFWQAVPEQLGWQEDRVQSLQATLYLAEITGYHRPLMELLQRRDLRRTSDLLKLDRAGWVRLVTESGAPRDAPGDSDAEKIHRTADSISETLDATFPTQVMAHVAATSADADLGRAREPIARFFEREPRFDIRSTPVTTYLRQNAGRVYAGLDEDKQKLLRSQLQRLQRAFQLGGNRQQTTTLLQLGLDSSYHIVRYSADEFATQYGAQLGGDIAARQIHGRAEFINATLLQIYTGIWDATGWDKPLGLQLPGEEEKVAGLKELPTYKALFGGADRCACDGCHSFYSPAAYFVDLLHMLESSPDGSKPIKVLLERRPDLEHLELTCETANTLIPYADLVAQILESYIAENGAVAFNKPANEADVLPWASSEELRVNQVYRTKSASDRAGKAYAALQQAVFPLTRPFNQPLDTTRTYLEHLGTSRERLMPVFDLDPGDEAVVAHAAEILRLSPEEFEAVTGTDFGGNAPAPARTPESFFGLSLGSSGGDTPQAAFNHGRPDFSVDLNKPDRRAALIASLQNVLGLVLASSVLPKAKYGEYDADTQAAVDAFRGQNGLAANGKTDADFWDKLDTKGYPALSVLVSPVRFFLDRTRLTYPELVALVRTRFVNPLLQHEGDLEYLNRIGVPNPDVAAWLAQPDGAPLPAAIADQLGKVGESEAAFTAWAKARRKAVVLRSPKEAVCDLDRTILTHLDGTLLSTAELLALVRFVRLWRALDWTLDDLDRVVRPGALGDPDLIFVLASVENLRRRLEIPVQEIVALWETIPTLGPSPLYDRLFRNRAAQIVDPALELNRERNELSQVNRKIDDHVPAVVGAFSISAADFEAVRAHAGLAGSATLLTLEHLSALYRRAHLARALDISVPDLLTLLRLLNVDPFQRPADTHLGPLPKIVELVASIQESGASIGQLEYLCRTAAPKQAVAGVDPDKRRSTLASLIGALRALSIGPGAGESLSIWLAATLGPEGAQTAAAQIYGEGVYAVPVVTPSARSAAVRALEPLFSEAEIVAKFINRASRDAAGNAQQGVIDDKVALAVARQRDVLGRAAVKQTLSTDTALPSEVVAALLEQGHLFSSLSGASAAIHDYLRLDGDGLVADYFGNKTLADPVAASRTETDPLHDWNVAPAPGVPSAAFSVRWRGFLCPPVGGDVTLIVRANDGVRLSIDGKAIVDAWQDQAFSEFRGVARLEPGRFHRIELQHYNSGDSAQERRGVELRWSSASIPESVIPAAALYTQKQLDALTQRIDRFFDVALLLSPFKLSARELHALVSAGGSKMSLVAGIPVSDATAREIFTQWLTLRTYAALRDGFPVKDGSLAGVLARTADPVETVARLARVSVETVRGVVTALTAPRQDPNTAQWANTPPDLTTLDGLDAIAKALAVVGRIGASPAQLGAWARTREITVAPNGLQTGWFSWTAKDAGGTDRTKQNELLAQAAKEVVRAKYDDRQWREAAIPLNDALRRRRNAALVAYVLAMPSVMALNIDGSSRLFEHLLVDVEMDPCMPTSPLKQAIGSIQVFVEMIRMNLVPSVPPSAIDRVRWSWVADQQVWEANRRMLTRAEEYVEEDFRDDKTPEFKELEAEALQEELTPASAERLFRRYLEKVDAIANLVVCGTCLDDDHLVLHVVGRTASRPFRYFYRRLTRARGTAWTDGVWTAWEKMPVDIQSSEEGADSGVSLLPVAWHRRLFLFWPVFEEKPQTEANRNLPKGFEGLNEWHIKLAWSEYDEGRWSSTRTSAAYVVSSGQTDSPKIPPRSYSRNVGEPINEESVRDFAVRPIDRLAGLAPGGQELARQTHTERRLEITSILPSPAAHFLAASPANDRLSIKVYARYEGYGIGQRRVFVHDQVTIVKNGERSDEIEKEELDFVAHGTYKRVYEQIGRFDFPDCGPHVNATSGVQTLKFEDVTRPTRSRNLHMFFAAESMPLSSKLVVEFKAGHPAILDYSPSWYHVLDSESRAGFNRQLPFFYRENHRSYLVSFQWADAPVFLNPSSVTHIEPVPEDMRMHRGFGALAVAAGQVSTAPAGSAQSALIFNVWGLSAADKYLDGPSAPPMAAGGIGGITLQTPATPDALAIQLSELEGAVIANRIERYTFTPMRHPFTCTFLNALNSGGPSALLTLDNQRLQTSDFETTCKPHRFYVQQPYPKEIVDFSRTGACAKHNWEIFFHVPLFFHNRLAREGKFEEALRWLGFILDPMAGGPKGDGFWRVEPFRKGTATRVEALLAELDYTGDNTEKQRLRAEATAMIKEWMANPFRPHVLARFWPSAYMKHVFMKYLDTLIAWGDQLFMRDTIESINKATQKYLVCAAMLGDKPEQVPARGTMRVETYASLRGDLNILSDAQADLETQLPFAELIPPGQGSTGQLATLPNARFFCIPPSDKLLSYWDTVAERLFKIRHCRNIEGVERALPLWEPPIDPMLFVKAVAQGLDIASVLNDVYAPLPSRRFTVMLQKALEMAAEVRSLGATLLSIEEKGAAERLTLLRAQHETELLPMIKDVRKQQVAEAEQTRQSLERGLQVVQARLDFYEARLAEGLIAEEKNQLEQLDRSNRSHENASGWELHAQIAHAVPNFTVGGASGGTTTFGGTNVGNVFNAIARSYSYLSSSFAYRANRASITGGHTRRQQEWKLQRDLAKRELAQIQKQALAAEIRQAIADNEMRNHDKQLEQSRAVETLLRTRFTNEALYSVMDGSLRSLHFQGFRTAYHLAKQAQRGLQIEFNLDDSFIEYGAWDSSLRGLLSGERLYMQLKQMERAWLDQRTREFEIIRHISLQQLQPRSLIDLRQKGECKFSIPEWLLDLDYPGHYARRLKTLSLTIPAVVGPYTSLSGTLRLLKSRMRPRARWSGAYDADENLAHDFRPVEAIAVSTGQNDSGLFELNLRDERYLPFEGGGAISDWEFVLPKFRVFDYDTISDLVMHVRYTSRSDATLQPPAINPTRFRMFSARHEFPNEWRSLRGAGPVTLSLPIVRERFPLFAHGGTPHVHSVHAAVVQKKDGKATFELTAAGVSIPIAWGAQAERYLRRDGVPPNGNPVDVGDSGVWQLTFQNASAEEIANVQDVLLIADYTL
jgi:peptidoglycan hydrolase-like protein with peptidoglycan-binding domain